MWVMSRMSLLCRRRRISASSTVRLRLADDELAPRRIVERIRDGEDVLVTAARLVDEDDVLGRELRRLLEGLGERVRRFERRDDALLAHGERERVHHLAIGR